MKAAFISYNQTHIEAVEEILNQLNIRGFTRWLDVQGRGSVDGEPHYGSHAWPAKNIATLAIVDDNLAPILKKRIQSLDHEQPGHGLRIFFWETCDV
ncbi:MAG: PG0541 family transporter-associated protein [Bacteroidales bacterium]|jgi:hypothetical protein|nr:hypothetical protein [Bacteroidales bacterium]MDY0053167.1 hypothetical protein [Bacteroidales bacterium]